MSDYSWLHVNGVRRSIRVLVLLVAALAVATPAIAQSGGKLRIGFVFFLSGGGAAFGTHARDGAKHVVDALNASKVPAPYATKGFAGTELEAIFVDEAGGPQKQLAEYRRIVEREAVDVVIGYNSSADCNAIAPVVEELKKLTVFFYCGHPQLFEEVIPNPRYLFRTAPHGTMDQVAAARYVASVLPNVQSIAGINQNYSWGQETWAEFKGAMQALKPGIKVTTEQFPKLYAGEYGAEISALLTNRSDVVYTTFWGGDADAFVLQARGRGLAERTQLVLSMGAGVIDGLGPNMIEGTIIGNRGPHSYFARTTPLANWFRDSYRQAHGRMPPFGAYGAAQAILGLKAAYEKAALKANRTPGVDDVIEAFRGLEFETPSGFPIKMALAKGHQGIQATAYGIYAGWDKAKNLPIIKDVKYFQAECVNPPVGMRSDLWIKSGLKGAKCD